MERKIMPETKNPTIEDIIELQKKNYGTCNW